MAYPYIPPPDAHELQWQFAKWLARFGYDVQITISRDKQCSHTVEINAWSRQSATPSVATAVPESTDAASD